MKNIVAVIALVLGLAAGWFAGSWSGRDAREALAKAKELGDLAKVEHDKQVADLNTRITTLRAQYDRDKQSVSEEHARQSAELTAIADGAQSRAAQLEAARGQAQARVQLLTNQLKNASTPGEKKTLQHDLDVAGAEVKSQTAQIDGLVCMDAGVPRDVVALWNGSRP